MIYVDKSATYGDRGEWCHLWTDGDVEELHAFAERLGLRRSWLHTSHGISGAFIHYDLRPSKRKLALELGALEIPLSAFIREKMQYVRPNPARP